MDKILYATDLSERTEAAARRSVELARAHGASLRAVHVIEADLEEETLRLLFRGQGGRSAGGDPRVGAGQ